jgi:hypothetical protein
VRRDATTQVSEINAEEGKTQSFKARLNLNPEDVDRLFGTGKPTLLRVTVTIQDNS